MVWEPEGAARGYDGDCYNLSSETGRPTALRQGGRPAQLTSMARLFCNVPARSGR
jgi:hypothetical protein